MSVPVMIADLRLAVRMLSQTPAFTLSAVLSLGLGIGASTSVYALTYTLFFAPPAGVGRPESLVRICRLEDGRAEGHELSYAEYVYVAAHSTVFSELAGDSNVRLLTDADDGSQLLTAVVSPGYFSTLGLRPHAGRFFLAAEDTVGADHQVVVLSHGFWQRRFAADPRAIGGRITLSRTSYAIVGVAPRGFEGSSAGWAPDIFVPTRAVFSEAELASERNGQLDIIGRLGPGRTVAEAQAEMNVLARRLQQSKAGTGQATGLVVAKLRGLDPEARPSQARLPALLVAVVVCLVTIACVNLAGLMQTRHAARRKEIAIRLALGAGRGRVVRQLLTESLLIAALGGAAGLVFASWGNALLERAYAREMFDGARHFYPLALDVRAFLLTLFTAGVTGVLFGLLPAWQASRPALIPALKEDASAPRRSRLRAASLVVRLALSLVLLIGAALAIQSTRTVWRNPGFDAGHVAYFNISPARAGHRGEKAKLYAGELRRRLESLPFVESISYSWLPPSLPAAAGILLPGQSRAGADDRLKASVNWISAGFFETLRIPVIQGRGIAQRDIDQDRALAVVNEALAHRLWAGRDPVGRTVMVDGRPFEVVGVMRYEGLRASGDTAQPYLFCSDGGRRQQGSLLVRVKGDAVASLPSLRREILAADAHVPINQAMSLSAVVLNQQADVPIAMGVLSFAGTLALLLTILGLYGVVALWVGQRTREIGIRVALGAGAAAIVALVLRQGLRLLVIGLPLGLAAALAAVRLLSSYLYGVSATDAATFAAITALLSGVALFACYLPAHRAARVDPVLALRRD
jgi:predicted permease